MRLEPKQQEEYKKRAIHSAKLQQTLELDGSPVAVAIVSEPFEGLERLRGKVTACVMIQIARRGGVFYSSGQSILCGGRSNLGMGEPLIRRLDDFLVKREKLFRTKTAAHKLLDSAKKQAPNHGRYLAFSPLEKAYFTPDVVLFIGIPAQISRIVFLSAFETGEFDTIHSEPLCSGTIAAPITSGKIGISFLDVTCRRFGRYRPEEMIVGVPYQKLLRIFDNIDLSSAGMAKPDRLLRLVGNLLRRRIPDNSRHGDNQGE